MGKQSLVWAEGRAAQLVWKDAAAVKTHATGRVVAVVVVVVVIGAAVVIAVAASTAAAGPSSPVAAAVAAISVGVA